MTDEVKKSGLHRAIRLSLILSLAFYAILINVNFDPQVQAVQAKAFGSAPFGMPVLVVVSICQTILFLPAPWGLWHFFALTFGVSRSQARSGLIFGGVSAYFVCIMAAWIVYAAILGI